MLACYEASGECRWLGANRATHILAVMAMALLCMSPDCASGFSTTTLSKAVVRPHTEKTHFVSLHATSVDDEQETNGETKTPRKRKRETLEKISKMPKRAFRIYTDYASRLWKETEPIERRRIAQDKAAAAVRNVQSIMQGEEYVSDSEESEKARQQLLKACQNMEKVMEKTHAASDSQTGDETDDDSASVDASKEVSVTGDTTATAKPKKARRSILFGAVMGAAVACWVFSGNYIFTGLFTLMTVLGQLEYYRMVMNTGIYPARRISIIGGCSMFLTALFAPELHQICLPMFGLWAMIWFLTMRRQVSTISEIATTWTGMFYLGYVPSFWVRIRLIGAGREPTRLAPIAAPFLNMLGSKAESLPNWIPSTVKLPITTGAIFIFWSWLCLAFSDVGAYFVGRKYGKTKLGKIAPAAGATSPNKSVEGVFGGCAVSAALGMLGAWVQKWPHWALTGAVHGIILGLLGLIGDLTASMLKRNAGLKDFGDLIPEHGGILDRVDSFVFTAPYSWLVCAYVIPFLKQAARARAALPV